ncbi:DinB family protein [Deinococcus sonorensis]|uniref:DinB family protein n=2 Tax=Deinococcus sonorensis TaxID=309891 RepID=A0AAU7U498_9DEIO
MSEVTDPVVLDAYLPRTIFYNDQHQLDGAMADALQGLDHLQQWLHGVPESALHQPVAPGKWSPAEYADHLVRTNRMIRQRLQAHLDGEAHEQVGYGAVYPDGRVVAHSGTEPVPGQNREVLTRALARSHSEVMELISRYAVEGRLTEPCLPHQYFGTLNAEETAQLIAAHYRRHLAQLLPAAEPL